MTFILSAESKQRQAKYAAHRAESLRRHTELKRLENEWRRFDSAIWEIPRGTFYNMLTITAAPGENDAIKATMQAETGYWGVSFQNAVPEQGAADPDAWRQQHWGTIEDASDGGLTDERDEYLFYHFFTEWSPPEAFVAGLSARFPDAVVRLDFMERETELEGYTVCISGSVTDTQMDTDVVEGARELWTDLMDGTGQPREHTLDLLWARRGPSDTPTCFHCDSR